MERFSDLDEHIYYEGEPHSIEQVYEWYHDVESFVSLLEELSTDYSRWHGDYADIWENFEMNGWDYDHIYSFVFETLQNVLGMYEDKYSYSDTIRLYRLIEVKDESEIDTEETGRHWSDNMDGVLGFIKNQGSWEGYEQALLVATTDIDNIDWVSRTMQFLCGYDFEDEYPVIDDSALEIEEKRMFHSVEDMEEWARSLQ